MSRTLVAFAALYTATLLMLLGSGLLSTYLALRLTESGVADYWAGVLMAANYFGLVLGANVGYRLIASVGHIRAYVACGAIATAAVLVHGLTQWLGVWVGMRMVIGMCMMVQYMVVESWLNEQTESEQRGMVFSGYMAAVYLGLMLGQLAIGLEGGLELAILLWVAIAFSLALVPVAVTRRMHPAPLYSMPMKPVYFLRRIPQSLFTTLVSGLIVGAFYGLGPVFASASGLTTQQVGYFMGMSVLAGLVVQWPLGKLSDRFDRPTLIRINAFLLVFACLPVIFLADISLPMLLLAGFVLGFLQFTLYPLAVAFANDHVPGEHRVALTAILLVTFSVGACVGPIMAGLLITLMGASYLYVYVMVCALLLTIVIRPQAVTGEHQEAEAPLDHQSVPPILGSSPLIAALDPRIDEDVVHEQMHELHSEPGKELT